ncbi:MAG: universal stress protein [Deltaproteobacteria bacterium]|jgi:nucleotide-binding universal stress UspA family protein|nr:universal stress protein [Deltaproteobacteria bacterium]
MEKKILLAVDDSRHSKNAIHYAVNVSSFVKNLHYVLFNVQPVISLFLKEEAQKSLMAKSKLENVVKKNKEAALNLLESYKDEMVEMGIDSNRIETVTRTRKLGLGKDIIDFAQDRNFDAIVVGRRGLSRLQEMYMGSVTSNVLEHSRVIPVWLVDGNVSSTKILVAIDGSESSLRTIDHVSFMISNNPNVRLTLLHVTNNARNYCGIDLDEESIPELKEIIALGDKACIEQFFPLAKKKFDDAGISQDQIEMKTVKGGRQVGKVILDVALKENYGTVIIGRRGVNKAFFMGSVSRYIINRISNRALWIVS